MPTEYKIPQKQAESKFNYRLLTALLASLALLFAVVIGDGTTGIPSRYAAPLPTPAPTATSWPLDVHFTRQELGVNIHMWWDPGPKRYEWAAADRIVDEATQAGVNLVFRVDMPPVWAMPEPGSPEFDKLPAYPDALHDFCFVLASRYKGRVRGYQVWNEPNLAREWRDLIPNPTAYVELLRSCYVGIKKADSQALVISAGLAPTGSGPPEAIPDIDYLIGMYEAGAAPYFDLLGLNAPGYKAPPEVSPTEVTDPDSGYGGHPTFCFRHAEDMRVIMEQYGDTRKQAAIMEFGWHTDTNPAHQDYAWFAVTPEQQADYLVRAYQYARSNWSTWVGPMFVWNFPDSHWTPDHEEYFWAIVDPFWWGYDGDTEKWKGGEVRPAYTALKLMPKP